MKRWRVVFLVGLSALTWSTSAGTEPVSGDLRYRHEMIDTEGGDARHRHRIRARVGYQAEVNDRLTFRFRRRGH